MKKTTNFYNPREKRKEGKREVLAWSDPNLRKRRWYHRQGKAMRKFNYLQLMEYL